MFALLVLIASYAAPATACPSSGLLPCLLPAYNLPLFPSSCSSFMWLSKHSFWRINRNVSILSAHKHTHTYTHMHACMYAWPLAHHPPLYPPLLLVLDSSANFPVDVGIFSVCHLNCLITWIDCEKRATAAAAATAEAVAAKATVTATYPFWAAGRGSCCLTPAWVIFLVCHQ